MIEWYWWVIGSAVLVAISNIIRKHVLNHQHAMEQLASSAPFRVLMLLGILPWVGFPGWRMLGLIYVASGVLFTAMLYRNKSYRHLPISTVAPLNNFSPVFLLLIGVLVLGEQLTWPQLAGVLLIMIGGYALDLKGRTLLAPLKHATRSDYTANVILMLIFLSIIAALDKTIINTFGVQFTTYLFWLTAFLVINSILMQYALYGLQDIKEDLQKGGVWLFFETLFSFASIILLYHAFSLPGVLVTLAIPIRRTATLLEIVLGGTLFHERGLTRKAVAGGVMVLGVLLIV